MRKLLLAEQSQAVIHSIQSLLCRSWDICVETDGYAVAHRAAAIMPEAMILNLDLPGKNGFEILEEMFPDIPPVVLVLTQYASPYILHTLSSYGVGCVLSFPISPVYVRKLIDDMYSDYHCPPNKVNRHLTALGLDGHLSGYRCLSAAITNYCENPSKLLKEIYPETARECGLNGGQCVEHAIRIAIKKAWLKRDNTVWSRYFPYNHNGDIDLPTNKAFLSAIGRHI